MMAKSKTFEQYCADVREDMQADGLYDMADASVYYDIAESLLYDPEFKKLAKKRFPSVKDATILRECVADSIYA